MATQLPSRNSDAQIAASIWHRGGRMAAAECLSGRSLGDAVVFRASLREWISLMPPGTDAVLEATRWEFVNQWGCDPYPTISSTVPLTRTTIEADDD